MARGDHGVLESSPGGSDDGAGGVGVWFPVSIWGFGLLSRVFRVMRLHTDVTVTHVDDSATERKREKKEKLIT